MTIAPPIPAVQATGGASSVRRVVVASLVGTSLEWYDFFLYGSAAALVFNKLFFPSFSPLTGTLLALTTYAVGFLARPIGGVVFGHYGDKLGRKNVLVVTLLLMGAATFLIGLLPTYGQVGVVAPILLVTLRFLQGLGLGGEWGGAVLMSLEHGRPGQRGLAASWPQVGVPMGNLLAAGVLGLMSFVLPNSAFLAWGWRLPFLLSGLLVFVGMWIRLTITESPLFAEAVKTKARARMPIIDVLCLYRRELLIAIGARIGTDIAFYTFVLFILAYVAGPLGLPRTIGLDAVLVGSACQLLLIPLFGGLSDRFGRRPVYLVGAVCSAVWVFAFFALLDTKSASNIILATVVALTFHAMMYGPQAAFMAEMFSTRLRYSGASLAYQIAGVLGGGLAPLISLALLARFHTPLAISIYVAGSLLITCVALLLAPETCHADLQAERQDRPGTPG